MCVCVGAARGGGGRTRTWCVPASAQGVTGECVSRAAESDEECLAIHPELTCWDYSDQPRQLLALGLRVRILIASASVHTSMRARLAGPPTDAAARVAADVAGVARLHAADLAGPRILNRVRARFRVARSRPAPCTSHSSGYSTPGPRCTCSSRRGGSSACTACRTPAGCIFSPGAAQCRNSRCSRRALRRMS